MSAPTTLLLCKHEMLSPKKDLGIEVVSGALWLTHVGCQRDTILVRGDKALLSVSRGSLVMALDGAEIRVEARETALWAR